MGREREPSSVLSPPERAALRRASLSKAQLRELPSEFVSHLTNISEERCRELRGLQEFESCSSVGPSLARDLWMLGYRSLADLKGEHAEAMYEQLCRLVGAKVDPCVEDVFRAVIAQVEDPGLPPEKQNWWYWTPMRKAKSSGQARMTPRGRSRPRGMSAGRRAR